MHFRWVPSFLKVNLGIEPVGGPDHRLQVGIGVKKSFVDEGADLVEADLHAI